MYHPDNWILGILVPLGPLGPLGLLGIWDMGYGILGMLVDILDSRPCRSQDQKSKIVQGFEFEGEAVL